MITSCSVLYRSEDERNKEIAALECQVYFFVELLGVCFDMYDQAKEFIE